MLLLTEYDFVLGSATARRCLADFLSDRPTITLAIFRSTTVEPVVMRKSCPANLRKRILLTPETPRESDLAFWLRYEVGCVTGALHYSGAMTQSEPWLTLVPPEWAAVAAANFGKKRVVVMPTEFCEADAERLRKSITAGRWGHVAPAPRSLHGSASAIAKAATSAGVKASSRGKSAGQSIRSASDSKRVATSATILG